MTLLLTLCFWLALGLSAATGCLMFAPAMHIELSIWRRFRVQHLRRWLTRSRHVAQPLDPIVTTDIARRNLRWHLFFTSLFCVQMAVAAVSEDRWWRPLAPLLVLPCIAYFAGSMVQRQKMVIVYFRRAAPRRPRTGATPITAPPASSSPPEPGGN